jgi:lipoate---protein ligase
MKKNIDYKVPNGKLLRVYAEIKEGKVKEIKITGDFFVHPEAGIEYIEEEIRGEKIEEIEEKISKIIENKKIEIIGFEIKDLVEILNRIEKEK